MQLPVETEAMISSLSQMTYGVFNASSSSEILNIEELISSVNLCTNPNQYVEVAKGLIQLDYSLGVSYSLLTDYLTEVEKHETVLYGELYESYKLDGEDNPLFGKIAKTTDKLIEAIIGKDREIVDYRETIKRLKACRTRCMALRDLVKSLIEISKYVIDNKDAINLSGFATPADIKKIAQTLVKTVDAED